MWAEVKFHGVWCPRMRPGSPLVRHLRDRSVDAKIGKIGVRRKRIATVGVKRKTDGDLGLTGVSAYKATRELDVDGRVRDVETSEIERFKSELEECEAVNGWDLQSKVAKEAAVSQDRRGMGRLLLLLVAVLWGTYSPAMKYMYLLPGQHTPVVLTALKSVIAATALLLSSAVVHFNKRRKGMHLGALESEGFVTDGKHSIAAGKSDGQNVLSGFKTPLIVCGIELGLWSLLGTASHAIGLQFTTATQGAFLIQSTALFTPVIAAAAGTRLSVSNWIGCFVGLLGSIVVTLQTTKSLETGGPGLPGLTGDAFVLGAAFIYALSTVRLCALAQRFRAMDLATAKTVTLAVFAVLWALWENAGCFTGKQSLTTVLEGFSTWQSLLVLVWTAIGPGAIASFLQTKGQQCLGPAESQVLFASTPFWSALFAWLFLSEGEMGMLGWVGGCIIIVAGIFSSSDGKKST